MSQAQLNLSLGSSKVDFSNPMLNQDVAMAYGYRMRADVTRLGFLWLVRKLKAIGTGWGRLTHA